MENLEPYSFTGPNPLWDDIIKSVKDNIELESSYAVGEDLESDQRAWACGRAAALRDFLVFLEEKRASALGKN